MTYVGTLPDASFSRALGEWALRRSGVTPLGLGLPEPVRVTRARARTGQRLWFFTNWSFDRHVITAPPVTGRDLFDGSPVGTGHGLELPPWGVTVVVEE